MNLVHVVPHISSEASGPSYSVPRLCQSLAGYGHKVTLSCLRAERDVPGIELSVHPEWPVLRRFAVSPSHACALARAARQADIVHNHSLWSMVNVASGWVVPGKRAKLVASPRGTLSQWALSLSRRRKQLLWPAQKRVLSKADLLHATSEEEYADIRRAGFSVPVAILPNGIDLPETLAGRAEDGQVRTLLFLSRVHPTKGIERLLDAWAPLESRHADWRLKIVGPGDVAYIARLQTRASRIGARRVVFSGAKYGQDKAAAYRNADLFILPTHSENFGMAVAESLAYECPAIVSHGAPWAGLETQGCGWWVSNDVDSLRATLDAAMSLSRDELYDMGVKGRLWMQRDFSWEAIAGGMDAAYRWLVEGGSAPECVRPD